MTVQATNMPPTTTQAETPAPSRLPQWLRMVPMPRRHWTPRYVVNRLRLAFYQRAHPDDPWLTAEMIRFLEGWLRPTDVMVEFGSGRSTVWFARRVGRLISNEHHQQWHQEISRRLEAAGLRNVRYLCVGKSPEEYLGGANTELPPSRADVILIDGLNRDCCAMWALQNIRPGGVILIDNVQRYLPHATFAPAAVGAGGAPASDMWREFQTRTSGWRRYWTSDGINDTVAFFAPES